MSLRYYTPSEVVRTFGISPKALRLYEAKALIKPFRDANGWRAFGPECLSRLVQILALKDLGFSLEQIGALLRGRLASLDAVLAVQEQTLRQRREGLDAALTDVLRARAALARGESLSIDDLITLRQEAAMSDATLKQIFDPLIDKHFTAEDQKALDQRKASFNPAEVSLAWEAVYADARAAYEQGDPASEFAKAVARRWMALVNQFSGGDAALNHKSASVLKDAFDDPDTAAQMPFSQDVWRFIGEAWKAAQT